MGSRAARATRCTWGLLCGLVLAGLCGPASAGVSVSIFPDTSCVEYGELFTVYVWVDSAGSAFDAYETVITYDPTQLTVVSAQQESLMVDLCGNTWWRTDIDDPGIIFISHVAMCGGLTLTGPGALSSITFEAPWQRTLTPVTFNYIDFFRAGNPVASQSHDGAVLVTAQCPALGACCLASGACAQVTGSECAGLAGDFLGYFVSCAPNPCPQPGVCCVGTVCHFVLAGECEALEGQWHPEWQSCDPDPCVAQGLSPGEVSAPAVFLLEARPNPFTCQTALHYRLDPHASSEPPSVTTQLSIEVFDAAGRSVCSLSAPGPADGAGSVVWDGRDSGGKPVTPGAYFCRLTYAGMTAAQRLVIAQ